MADAIDSGSIEGFLHAGSSPVTCIYKKQYTNSVLLFIYGF